MGGFSSKDIIQDEDVIDIQGSLGRPEFKWLLNELGPYIGNIYGNVAILELPGSTQSVLRILKTSSTENEMLIIDSDDEPVVDVGTKNGDEVMLLRSGDFHEQAMKICSRLPNFVYKNVNNPKGTAFQPILYGAPIGWSVSEIPDAYNEHGIVVRYITDHTLLNQNKKQLPNPQEDYILSYSSGTYKIWSRKYITFTEIKSDTVEEWLTFWYRQYRPRLKGTLDFLSYRPTVIVDIQQQIPKETRIAIDNFLMEFLWPHANFAIKPMIISYDEPPAGIISKAKPPKYTPWASETSKIDGYRLLRFTFNPPPDNHDVNEHYIFLGSGYAEKLANLISTSDPSVSLIKNSLKIIKIGELSYDSKFSGRKILNEFIAKMLGMTPIYVPKVPFFYIFFYSSKFTIHYFIQMQSQSKSQHSQSSH